MLLSPLTFTHGDVAAASSVLMASAVDRTARGEELWLPQSLTPERLGKYYPPEGWQVAWHGGQPVGCYVLLDQDPLFWPDDPEGEALYLHKLAVHPEVQGRRLAWTLLQRAAQQAADRRRAYLRLDTATHRPKLRAVYESIGFEHVADRIVKSWAVSLYELPVQTGAHG
ncbi:GNAT family N-acetyltransferase [Deinococcus deserti]|uniref:N-acetyltransferase domain-containing protein n=1 Tax=Deinococcus deserti (strain DSM 17065 / CIP 109153 / LMG 22923 / VCD115) TaxID=546414 RepID=C1D1G9_DEIDV|nr:GNAT family N-acetyltransferase [Deinococcus deserti]ACO45693.1 hypothetical protein Deide_08250 [Deinococcus deserti VCD115]